MRNKLTYILAVIFLLFVSLESCIQTNSFKITVTGGEHFPAGARVAVYRLKVEESPEPTEKLKIDAFKNNSFEYTGTVDDPHIISVDILPADDDHPYHRITMALEPGHTKINYTSQQDFKLAGGGLNDLLVNSWNDDIDYKKAKDAFGRFSASMKSGDLKDKILREQYMKKLGALNKAKQEAMGKAFNRRQDPFDKLLLYSVGYRGAKDFSEFLNSWGKLSLSLADKREAKLALKQIKDIKESQRASSKVGIGSVIKDFVAQDLNGKTFHLANVLKENKYVLVEFWASWCSPCRGEIPHMKNAYSHFKEKGFEIVSFTLDHEKERWEKASKDEQIPWINTGDLLANTSPVVKLYGVMGVPANYLVEAETGKIIAKNLRGEELDLKLEDLFVK